MPLVSNSTYRAPLIYQNGHISTILPSLINNPPKLNYRRDRLELDDGDFLDLDWLDGPAKNKLVILSHGLEGSSDRYYIKQSADYFQKQGWHVLAWNYRSCSGELNRLPRLYHHGVTEDLEAVINHAFSLGYDEVHLIGFSMGGSTTLKFLGEKGQDVDDRIKGAVVFSVPCNLWNSAEMLLKPSNRVYKRRFLRKLKKKIARKAQQFPSEIDISGIDKLNSFEEFDNRYTAPLHGFESARHFYESSTCDAVIPNIQRRALIVNALNDPLLGDKCYPFDMVRTHAFVFLETPAVGGHVGFPEQTSKTWCPRRAIEFFEEDLSIP